MVLQVDYSILCLNRGMAYRLECTKNKKKGAYYIQIQMVFNLVTNRTHAIIPRTDYQSCLTASLELLPSGNVAKNSGLLH